MFEVTNENIIMVNVIEAPKNIPCTVRIRSRRIPKSVQVTYEEVGTTQVRYKGTECTSVKKSIIHPSLSNIHS